MDEEKAKVPTNSSRTALDDVMARLGAEADQNEQSTKSFAHDVALFFNQLVADGFKRTEAEILADHYLCHLMGGCAGDD